MTSNFQPSEDTFDDVSGHGISSGRIDGPDAEDTRATAASSRSTSETPRATAASSPSRPRTPRATGSAATSRPPTDDDTEGHGIRVKI